MVSGRGFPHYVEQAEPVLCLALAAATVTLWRRYGHRRLLVPGTVAATFAACQLVLWIPLAEVALASGHGLPASKDDGVSTTQLAVYYVDGYRRLIDPSAGPMFELLFPTDLITQHAVASAIDGHSAPGERVFVWGEIPWIYTLSNRMPAGRYVALNAAYYVDRSAEVTLLGELEAHPPVVLIVETHPTPEALLEFLVRHRYQRVVAGVGGVEYWVLAQR
jgi:hypothetical protein